MIETQGGGIRKIFNFQCKRYFPLPDYYFSNTKIKVTITGKVLNEDFARILKKNSELLLEEIILLDKVQKKKQLNADELTYLRKKELIEGRKPNVYLSFQTINHINNNGLLDKYNSNKSYDDAHFKKMILEYIKKGGSVKRKSIDNLIIPKLSQTLSDSQKKNKVTNFLTALRMENKIKSSAFGIWEIFK